MRIGCLISMFFLFLRYGYAQHTMFPNPLSPRIANYTISVRLDDLHKKLYGEEILSWRNESDDWIYDLHFHLYLNAFKDENSTFMQESGDGRTAGILDEDEGWGWINIISMKTKTGTVLTDNFTFIHPDDDNELDQTVLQVILDEPIKPRQSITLQIEFQAQLPRVAIRTGYKGDFIMAGQWFPKIGVYEAAGDRYASQGQWNCHQFHANSEFYADYGVYDVTIILPQKYSVGASGILLDIKNNNDDSKTYHFYCEDIHDFAWTADTDFKIIEDQWKQVKIRFFAQPLHETLAHRQIMAAKKSLEYCEEWYGPYPYPILTIVDPQYGAVGAGGMEYPTLITARAYWLTPVGIKLPEAVVIHEFGHNYFYGMIGSNEFEEAWLDEGMTTYTEIKVQDTYYGKNQGSILSLFGININMSDWEWSRYARRPDRDIVIKDSWEYQRSDYRTYSYSKPAMILLTLENYLGKTLMKKIMSTYFERYKFKHPTTDDFIHTVNEITGQDFQEFFDQVLYTREVLDYGIERIIINKLTSSGGEESDLSSRNENDHSDGEILYRNQVSVSRKGKVIFPVEILLKFENGQQIRENWDGQETFKEYCYERPERIISAEVDPDRKIWLDINFLNNGKTVSVNRTTTVKYVSRWLFWLQNFLHWVSIFS